MTTNIATTTKSVPLKPLDELSLNENMSDEKGCPLTVGDVVHMQALCEEPNPPGGAINQLARIGLFALKKFFQQVLKERLAELAEQQRIQKLRGSK